MDVRINVEVDGQMWVDADVWVIGDRVSVHRAGCAWRTKTGEWSRTTRSVWPSEGSAIPEPVRLEAMNQAAQSLARRAEEALREREVVLAALREAAEGAPGE